MTKRIHFIWFNRLGNKAPAHCLAFVDQWRMLNPCFDVKIWGTNELSALSAKCARVIRSAKDEADAADYLRLVIIQKYGGFYTDIDTQPIKPIDSLLDDSFDLILGDSGSNEVPLNAFYGNPNSPVMNYLVDNYESPRKPKCNAKAFALFSAKIKILPWQYFHAHSLSHLSYTLHWPHRLASWGKRPTKN